MLGDFEEVQIGQLDALRINLRDGKVNPEKAVNKFWRIRKVVVSEHPDLNREYPQGSGKDAQAVNQMIIEFTIDLNRKLNQSVADATHRGFHIRLHLESDGTWIATFGRGDGSKNYLEAESRLAALELAKERIDQIPDSQEQ